MHVTRTKRPQRCGCAGSHGQATAVQSSRHELGVRNGESEAPSHAPGRRHHFRAIPSGCRDDSDGTASQLLAAKFFERRRPRQRRRVLAQRPASRIRRRRLVVSSSPQLAERRASRATLMRALEWAAASADEPRPLLGRRPTWSPCRSRSRRRGGRRAPPRRRGDRRRARGGAAAGARRLRRRVLLAGRRRSRAGRIGRRALSRAHRAPYAAGADVASARPPSPPRRARSRRRRSPSRLRATARALRVARLRRAQRQRGCRRRRRWPPSASPCTLTTCMPTPRRAAGPRAREAPPRSPPRAPPAASSTT